MLGKKHVLKIEVFLFVASIGGCSSKPALFTLDGTSGDSTPRDTLEPEDETDTTEDDSAQQGETDVETDTGSDSDTDSDSDSDSDADADADTETETDSATDTICAEQNFSIEYLPTRLMMALDMSGSMTAPDDVYGDNSRYDSAVEAINVLLRNFEGRFLFGFDTYPDRFERMSCAVSDAVLFDCGADTVESIIAWLNAHEAELGPGDPLTLELEMFLEQPNYAPKFTAETKGESVYLLIISDGEDCCGPEGTYDCTVDHTEALVERTQALLAAGIRTITIGYTDNADAKTLDAVAENGGTAFDTHLRALDLDGLTEAFNTIAGTIAGCNFQIDDPGPQSDPDLVNFYFDNETIPFDKNCTQHTGWTWEDEAHTRMRFCEASCARLGAGDVDRVVAKFGCPVIIIV